MRYHRFLIAIAAVQLFIFSSYQPAFSRTAHIAYSRSTKVAPADEYFGRLKMSILGIRNELHDLDQRLTFSPDKSDDVLGSAAFVENAIKDWEHKYPADPWLAKSVYELDHLYARIHSPAGHAKAVTTLHWLVARYRRSPFCTTAAAEVGEALR